eukprot:Lankesteria_metandrocarpae@DN6441_c0_g1_i1.p1
MRTMENALQPQPSPLVEPFSLLQLSHGSSTPILDMPFQAPLSASPPPSNERTLCSAPLTRIHESILKAQTAEKKKLGRHCSILTKQYDSGRLGRLSSLYSRASTIRSYQSWNSAGTEGNRPRSVSAAYFIMGALVCPVFEVLSVVLSL